MIKKFLFILMLIVVVGAIGVAVLYRNLPDLLVAGLEKALHRDVEVGEVRITPPFGFHIRGLAVGEIGPFKGEQAFYAEEAVIHVDPRTLLGRDVVIRSVEVTKPQMIVRKFRRWVSHVLSPGDAPAAPADPRQPPVEPGAESGRRQRTEILIKRLTIRDGFLRWIDYDIAQNGFAIDWRGIEADVENIASAPLDVVIRYRLRAEMLQGRQQPPALVNGLGWTHRRTWDTDANIQLKDFWIPYVAPYYAQITSARIDSGLVHLQSTTIIKNRDWTTNARADVRGLRFTGVETGQELFGLDAAGLLDMLRSRSGNMVLDLILRWNLNDPQASFKQALRKSIRHSLKSTLLSNLQNVVTNTLDRLGQEGSGFLKDEWKGTIEDLIKLAE